MSTSDEKARLAALRRYAVLDTPPEAPFDRIARLAARLFEAPIALVTLVDEDRQWFKAGIGFGQNETDIELSFCAHTIRDEGVMVVEDATEDERFADNPLVTGEPGIRFYAGAPLVTPDGYRIGSVCVIDTAPRTLDAPASLDALQDLADMAMDQMQRRVTHPHHTDVLESITDAFFALDDEWRFTYLNEQAEALLLRSRDELLGRNVWDEFPDAVELDFYEQYHRAVREGEHVQFEAYFPPLDTWFQINAYPFDGGLSVFFDDITARKKTEDTLRAREEYLAVTLRSIGDAVIATDAEGRVTEMNSLAERLTGWPVDAASGRPLDDIFHIENSKTGAPVENPVRNVLEEGQIVGLANHTMLTARDGTQYQIADSAAPIRTDDGELLGVVMVFRDVTDKYEQEEALRAERNLLAGVFDTSAAAITVVDASGQIIRVNERAEEVLGLGTSDVEGRPYDDPVWTHMTVDGSPLPDEELPFARVMASEAPVYDAQYTIEWPDGRRRILSISGAPLQDDDGTVTGAVFSLDDITDEHEQREALEAQHERLEMALIGGNIGMWDWDMQTDATVYDERWAAMLGYTLDEVEYENTFFERHTHPDDLERVYDDIERHAAGELPYLDQEIRMRHRDGSWRWVLDRGKIVERAEDGTPRRMVGTHVDITEKKRREEALRERTIALRQAQRVTKTGNGSIDLVEETIDLSEEAGRLLGLDPSVEQPVEAFMALVHPGDQELVQQEFERVAAGELHDETYRIIPAGSDTVRWLRGQGRPEADETGAVTRVFSTITDITEQRAREQALRESRQLLKESQRIAHLGHWDWNVETGAIHWSDETYRIFGYEPGAFDPTRATYFEAIPEPDRQRIEALNRQSIETGHMDSAEHRIVRPDGSERIVELSGVITEEVTRTDRRGS